MSNISDNALSKMRIARAYIQILCILEDRSEASVSLASIGNCEIRMFVGSKAHSDGMSLSWLELFDHDAKTSVDSYSCHKIEDAVVPVVNQIRTYWWCSPPRTGRQRMLPARSTARETGASFSKDRCVRTSL